MPTYNGERFLLEQLDSIAAQTHRPTAVVISDDGSTDQTVDIVMSFGERAGIPVQLLVGAHLGLRQNVERALRHIDADVVVLADQDDVWAPDRLAAITRAFADPDVQLWFSDAQLIDAHGALIGASTWNGVALDDSTRIAIGDGRGLGRLIHGQTVTGATMAFRRSVLDLALPLPEELEGPDHPMLHDGWIAVLASLIGRTVIEPRALTSYRQHDGQVTQMSMATVGGSVGTRRATKRERTRQLHLDRTRVRLVLDRLRERDALGMCREQDVDWLVAADSFYAARTAAPGTRRLRGILSELRAGRYDKFARGWRTAAIDAISAPPAP